MRRIHNRCCILQGLVSLYLLMILPACSGVSPSVEKSEDMVQLKQQVQKNREVLEEMRDRMSVLQFMIDDHDRSLRILERAMPPQRKEKTDAASDLPTAASGKDSSYPESAMTGVFAAEDPEALYNKALGTYNARDYNQCKPLFEQFLATYPEHDLADNARYWMGECLYSQKNYLGAIDQFKKVVQQYPEGGKVPAALLKTGFAYYSLDDFENARNYLKKVIINYPFSAASDKAEKMLRKIE